MIRFHDFRHRNQKINMSLLSALLRRARPSHMIWARSILHQTSLRLSSTSAAAGTSAPAPSAAPNATGTPRNLLGSLVLPTANRRVSTDPKVLSSFLFWLAQRGADFRHVDVRPIGAAKSAAFSGNWGVFAAKDCVAGEVLARLPLKCTVGTNFDPRLFEAKKEEKADKVKDATPNPLALAAAIGNDVAAQQADSYEESFQTLLSLLPVELNELKMGLRLLAERCRPYEKHSSFWPYIGALPLHIPGIPIFFSSLQLAELQYPHLQTQVKRRCMVLLRLAQVINQHFRHLFFGTEVDASALAWAMSAASSRAFGIDEHDKRMLPLIDMMNHSFQPSARVAFRKAGDSTDTVQGDGTGMSAVYTEDSLVVRATRPIKKDEELTICYGNQSNDEFLMLYGFLPLSTTGVPSAAFDSSSLNPHDTFRMGFDPNTLELAADLAQSPFPHGAELVMTPGWKRVALLQHRCGGLLPKTAHAAPSPTEELKPSSEDAELKKLNANVQYFMRQTSAGGVDSRFLAALRILYAEKDIAPAASSDIAAPMVSTGVDLSAQPKSGTSVWEQPLAAGKDVERKVLRCALSSLSLITQSFATTLERDRAILAKKADAKSAGATGEDGLLAVRFRMGKKLILEQNIEQVRQMLGAL